MKMPIFVAFSVLVSAVTSQVALKASAPHEGVLVTIVEPEPVPRHDGALRGYMLAIAEGRLAVRDNCLVVKSEAGEIFQPLMSNENSDWQEETRTLRFGTRDYRIGDTIRMGGGGVVRENLSARIADKIPDCGDARLWSAKPL